MLPDSIKTEGMTFLPEFVDHKSLRALFGLSRAHAYLLAGEGKIRSVCIRRPGANRGKRLFDCQSVRDFLAKCMANRATAYPIGRNVYARGYGAYNANTFTTVSSTPSYSTTIRPGVAVGFHEGVPSNV
jgi:hypothetical protein